MRLGRERWESDAVTRSVRPRLQCANKSPVQQVEWRRGVENTSEAGFNRKVDSDDVVHTGRRAKTPAKNTVAGSRRCRNKQQRRPNRGASCLVSAAERLKGSEWGPARADLSQRNERLGAFRPLKSRPPYYGRRGVQARQSKTRGWNPSAGGGGRRAVRSGWRSTQRLRSESSGLMWCGRGGSSGLTLQQVAGRHSVSSRLELQCLRLASLPSASDRAYPSECRCWAQLSAQEHGKDSNSSLT